LAFKVRAFSLDAAMQPCCIAAGFRISDKMQRAATPNTGLHQPELMRGRLDYSFAPELFFGL
jgi:hypothetical protein